jgi:hypothetical protein
MLSAPPGEGLVRIFERGRGAVLGVAGAGFATTLLATIVSSVPTKDVADPDLFVLKVVGGAGALLGLGLAVFAHGRRAAIRRANGDAA